MSKHDDDTCPHLVRASLLEAENSRLKTEVQHLMIFCNSTLIPSKELQAENARLKAEVEELRGNPDPLTAYLYAAELCKDDIKTLKDEVKRLTLLQVETLDERNKAEAEVERLRYVGDGMAVMVGHIEVTGDAHRMMLELSKEWEAAKEGKPSE